MTLRLILGDQLNSSHSWFSRTRGDVSYVLMEIRQESEYVTHHAQKVIGFFAAMRRFADWLRDNGHRVIYLHIGDAENTQTLCGNLDLLIARTGATHVEYMLPDEYRLDEQLRDWCSRQRISAQAVDSEHFFTSRETLALLFRGKKSYRMETFYRAMRKQHNILLDGGEPLGGRWNYDTENREAYEGEIPIPPPLLQPHDYSGIWGEIQRAGIRTIGSPQADCFSWPTSRQEALDVLQYFLTHLLPHFGRYQDAMHTSSWSMFHSRLSFALNLKMISPSEVVDQAVRCHLHDPHKVSIAACEGFVRQILGWREYMRGVYWAGMPRYSTLNFFSHHRRLPAWYWTGETKMNCLRHAIRQSLEHAYAHHIQRLMITGNFALLAGVDPDEVDRWYLGVYIDAIEWVEITNTRGMSQYADGGLTASKPYVSTAQYVDRMSNYCRTCHYDRSRRTGERACPLNSLYWNFYDTHAGKLRSHPRIGMVYPQLDRMSEQQKAELRAQADRYLGMLDSL